MQEEKLISVICITHNSGKLISDTIDSILQQTYKNLELIVADDGSNDNTIDIIKSYQDSRIKIIALEENHHVCTTSNIAFNHARGEYIALIGHDDIWNINKLEKQIRFLEENKNYGICFSWVDIIDDSINVVNEKEKNHYELFHQNNRGREEWILRLIKGNCLCAPTALIDKDIFRKLGGYNYGLVQLQDYDMWLKALLYTDIYVYPEKLVFYRRFQNESMLSSTMDEGKCVRVYNEHQYVVRKFLNLISDELFLKTFCDFFKYAYAASSAELECEKAFLLYELNNPYYIEQFIELLNREETRKILENKYKFCEMDFYKLNEQRIYWDEWRFVKQNRLINEYQILFEQIDTSMQAVQKSMKEKDMYIMQLEETLKNVMH